MKIAFGDFIQNVSQDLSNVLIQVDKSGLTGLSQIALSGIEKLILLWVPMKP